MKVRDEQVLLWLTAQNVICTEPLLPGISIQNVELIALTKTLELEDSKKTNIHTDGRYAFATAYVPRDICQERGLLTLEETNRKSWTSWMP